MVSSYVIYEPDVIFSYLEDNVDALTNQTTYYSFCSGLPKDIMINGVESGRHYGMSYESVPDCDDFQIAIYSSEGQKLVCFAFSDYGSLY